MNPELASGLASVALANVVREYPRKIDHLLTSPAGDLTPRSIHPAFYGSYDWHSAVHMHWLLVRMLRTRPQLAEAADIAAVLDAHLSPDALAIEASYFKATGRQTFERPYGWAWLLELQAEALRLAACGHAGGARWSQALGPFATDLARRMQAFLAIAAYPIRTGMHASTAFACILALDYARNANDTALIDSVRNAAHRWYSSDRDAPVAYEPSQADFLSPALVEAQLMCELLPAEEARFWLSAFIPNGLGPLADPPIVADRSDAQFSHLDGLSLSRAWSLTRIATVLPESDAHLFRSAAERHLDAGLPQVVGGDYAGEHWLASFAALALGDTP